MTAVTASLSPASPRHPPRRTYPDRAGLTGGHRRTFGVWGDPQRTRARVAETAEWPAVEVREARVATRVNLKERSRNVGVPWDFSGTSGSINGYERETAERTFAQVSDPRLPIVAGHVTPVVSSATSDQQDSVGLRSASPALGAHARHLDKGPTCPTSRLIPHQNERHERHFSVKISPVTPTPHIMRTHKTAGQEPFAAGSRMATHST